MALEQIEAKAVELIGKLEAVAPQVTSAALEAVRTQAYVWIISGSVASLLALLIFGWAALCFYFGRRESDDGEKSFAYTFGAFTMLAGLAVSIFALAHLASPWTWVTLNHPEVWLAKKALGL